jgi:hypothetical protein
MGSLVFRIAGSGGDGDDGGFIAPFMYLPFEASASAYVTGISGSQSGYTGSLNAEASSYDGIYASAGFYGYSTQHVFSGSYAFRIPQTTDVRYLDFGTITERPEWGTLFSGSFSVAAWVYIELPESQQTRYGDTPIFGFGPFDGSNQGFSFNLDRNVSAWGEGGLSYKSYGSDGSGVNPNGSYRNWSSATSLSYQGWNHVVFVVSGSTSVTNRRVKAYLNNNDAGFMDDAVSGQYFQKTFDPSKTIHFGKNTTSREGNYSLDEASIWNIALSTEQVNALYNSGNGASALTALTSSG